MLEIVPAILTNDPRELDQKIRQVESFAKRVHIDIIDSSFAKNPTISPEALLGIETNLFFDVHLMVNNPASWVGRSYEGLPDRIIGQIEMMKNQEEFVAKVAEGGAHIGLAIDLHTPVASIETILLRNIDSILVMGVKAGLGGQQFEEKVLEKIKQLDEIRAREQRPFKIIVDGGVTPETIGKITKAGADEVAAASAVFSGNSEENIQNLLKSAYI